MSVRLQFTMAPSEKLGITFNYAARLAAGETVASVAATDIIMVRGHQGDTDIMATDGVVGSDNQTVTTTVTVPADAAGKRFNVVVKVVTSANAEFSLAAQVSVV